MNYEKIYYDFCSSRQKLPRKKNQGIYFEEHHIKPKSLYPELKKEKTNLVLLTPREHYLAHLLLIRFMEGDDKFRMICAFCRFCHGKNAEKFKNGKEYEKYRLIWHEELGKRLKGRKINPDSIKKAIETKKRNGFKHTEETKKILRQKAKEQFASEEARRHMSEKILTYFSTHPGRGPKGHKFGPHSEERKIKTRNAVVNSEKWHERYYNVMCIETGERFSQSLLANKLDIPRHKLKPLIIKEEEINGKHYKFIK